jgi:hypothetical protein
MCAPQPSPPLTPTLHCALADPRIVRFLQDDFLAKFLVRHVFCEALLHCHNNFAEASAACFPVCAPALPDGLHAHAEVRAGIAALAEVAGVTNFYERAKASTV